MKTRNYYHRGLPWSASLKISGNMTYFKATKCRRFIYFYRLFGCPKANFGALGRQNHSPNVNHCVLSIYFNSKVIGSLIRKMVSNPLLGISVSFKPGTFWFRADIIPHYAIFPKSVCIEYDKPLYTNKSKLFNNLITDGAAYINYYSAVNTQSLDHFITQILVENRQDEKVMQ